MVILVIPSSALLDQNIPLTAVIAFAGFAGMLFGIQFLSTGASLSLLALLVYGKAATTVLGTSPIDTALLLVEFTMVLVLMEASLVVLAFNKDFSKLRERKDELSLIMASHLRAWIRIQLSGQGRLALVALGLSIGLLPVAGFTSIQSNQLVFSATLALLAVVVLLFLLTHRREPEVA